MRAGKVPLTVKPAQTGNAAKDFIGSFCAKLKQIVEREMLVFILEG